MGNRYPSRTNTATPGSRGARLPSWGLPSRPHDSRLTLRAFFHKHVSVKFRQLVPAAGEGWRGRRKWRLSGGVHRPPGLHPGTKLSFPRRASCTSHPCQHLTRPPCPPNAIPACSIYAVGKSHLPGPWNPVVPWRLTPPLERLGPSVCPTPLFLAGAGASGGQQAKEAEVEISGWRQGGGWPGT